MSLSTTLKSSAATNCGKVTHTGDQPEAQRPDLPASLNRDRLLDSGQTATFLGISLPHLRRLYRARRVPPPILIGLRKYSWQAGVLIDFVAAKTSKAAA
jgi:predicted DNA-binding transcriptional regulator AlpA